MYEGLIVRISGFMRKIHLIVIHCSATRADKELTAFDLDTMHRRRGFNGTGYHYYIRKDGTTHLTRPVERIGAHAKGFNTESIGICYEGGLDCRGRPADTRTPEQRAALRLLVPSIEELGYMLDRPLYCKWQEKAGGEDVTGILSLEEDVKPLAARALSMGTRCVLLKCG